MLRGSLSNIIQPFNTLLNSLLQNYIFAIVWTLAIKIVIFD
jgi:hypothetical protein